MKQDWQVSGMITFIDSSFSQMSASWPALTSAEAEQKMETTVRQEMRKKRVHAVRIEAVSHTQGGYALLQKMELK